MKLMVQRFLLSPREGNLFTEMYAVDYFDIDYEKYKCYYNMKHVETICNNCRLQINMVQLF